MTLGFNFVRGQYQVFQNPETVQWAFFENAGGSYGHMGGHENMHFFFYCSAKMHKNMTH
jgi:hypothetical protein